MEVEETSAREELSETENCFGEVVDNYKLDKMARYMGKPKTQADRAQEAWNLVNEDNKHDKASTYVEGLKSTYGKGTQCLVYNATGDTIHLVSNHDLNESSDSSTSYPTEIGNGQWGAFYHARSRVYGSTAAVVYRGKNNDGEDQDFLLGWFSGKAFLSFKRAYCEIGGVDNVQTRKDEIIRKIVGSGYFCNAKSDKCEIEAKISKDSA